jgi:hypothetical protein
MLRFGRRCRRRRRNLCMTLRHLKSTAKYRTRSTISRPFVKRTRPARSLLDMGCMYAALPCLSFICSPACSCVWLVISRLCQRKLVWRVPREVGTLRRAPQVRPQPSALLLSTPLSQHRSLISRDTSCSSITCRIFHLKPRALSVCVIPRLT